MKYIAFVTKGLEKIAESEICSLVYDAQILEIGDKRIVFETSIEISTLAKLKTVDDICLFIGIVENVNNADPIINPLVSAKYQDILDFLSKYREMQKNTFSLTVSMVGNEQLEPQELINTVSETLKGKFSWIFQEKDHSNFDIRIFIDHNTAHFGVRLTKESLHHRKYKILSKQGSLRPTVAAAMVLLATANKNGLKVIDNFCGSGTILCEANSMDNQVYGGDIDSESVQITKGNLSQLNYSTQDKIKVLNATKTNWPSNYFDIAVSNLPWNKQVEVEHISKLYAETLKEYKRILKRDATLCLLVSKPEILVKYAKKEFPDHQIKVIKIGLLGQNPSIVLVNKVV